MYRFPLRLPYVGATTIQDADGVTVAECPDVETAEAVLDALLALKNIADGWIMKPYSEAANALQALRKETP